MTKLKKHEKRLDGLGICVNKFLNKRFNDNINSIHETINKSKELLNKNTDELDKHNERLKYIQDCTDRIRLYEEKKDSQQLY